MQFPILSVIVFTPIIAGLLILLIPEERKTEIRVAALAAGALTLLLSIWVYFSYDVAAGGYQFIEMYDWLPVLGISYHVGVDGISTPLVLLTGIVIFTGFVPPDVFGYPQNINLAPDLPYAPCWQKDGCPECRAEICTRAVKPETVLERTLEVLNRTRYRRPRRGSGPA